MSKIFKLFSQLALGAAIALIAAPASGQQGNGQLLSTNMIHEFSASDVSSMLGEFDIATALQPNSGDGAASMVATTSGGATFIITMLLCDDVAQATGCKQAVIYTGMSNSGIAYDDLNTFHTNADVTRAINVPDQQLIVFGTQIFAQGGIGRENFKLLTALFLKDMQEYVLNQASLGTSVAMRFEKKPENKSDNMLSSAGEGGQSFSPRIEMIDHALVAALANTRYADFLNEKASLIIDE